MPSERKTCPTCCASPIARRQRIVACNTKILDLGSRKRPTPKSERQFQPSRPLFTRRMNCFSDDGVSSRMNSRISSFVVNLLSPTFTRIREVGMPRLSKVSSSAGFNSLVSSSIVAAKKASFGKSPSGRSSPAPRKNSSTAISTNSVVLVLEYPLMGSKLYLPTLETPISVAARSKDGCDADGLLVICLMS